MSDDHAGVDADEGALGSTSTSIKKPTTMKRRAKSADISRNELLKLLSIMEGELQAREISIATLKAEKAQHYVQKAKYGCEMTADGPYDGLRRDAELMGDAGVTAAGGNCVNCANPKQMLDSYVDKQHKAQLRTRIQLAAIEKQFHKVCAELEAEKEKSARVTAELRTANMDLTAEKEKLQLELSDLKDANARLIDDIQQLKEDLAKERIIASKHEQGAAMLARERKWFLSKIADVDRLIGELEVKHLQECARADDLARELAEQSDRHKTEEEQHSKDVAALNEQHKVAISEKEACIRDLNIMIKQLHELQKTANAAESAVLQRTNATASVDYLSLESAIRTPSSSGVAVSCNVTLPYSQLQDGRPDVSIGTTNVSVSFTLKTPLPAVTAVAGMSSLTSDVHASNSGLLVVASTPVSSSALRPFNTADQVDGSYRPSDLSAMSHSVSRRLDFGVSGGNLQPPKALVIPSLQTPTSGDVAPHAAALDIFGPEMADLQELFVTMAADKISLSSSSPSADDNVLPSSSLYTAVMASDHSALTNLLTSHSGIDLCERFSNGYSLLHYAVERNGHECVRIMLEHGADPNVASDDGRTPVHIAAANGFARCLQLLLEYKGLTTATDQIGWTPLHCAANAGHTDCCQLLLDNVAHIDSATNERIEVERRDKWNRSVLDVASPACRQFLLAVDGNRNDVLCSVIIGLQTASPSESQRSPKRTPVGSDLSSVTLGSLLVTKNTTWIELSEKLNVLFANHISEMSIGLRTKKTCRFDQDWPDAPNSLSLGISPSSIKYFCIGRYHWSPGTSTDKTPFDLLCGFNTNFISIKLFGLENGCQDSLVYESLIPMSALQNYFRLIEQYKSVVFYGPKGMGKTYLVRKLAQSIQAKEMQAGRASEITFFTLSTVFSRKDLLKLLLDKGCLIMSSAPPSVNTAPILILDDFSKISVVDVFKDILPAMETRNPSNSIVVRRDGSQESLSCYMHPNCYIIGTMDRSRSTGLELSIQQRFKWVQLRCDQEPMRCLLHRHLLRRLANAYNGIVPMPDGSVFKAVEWVICVWQRLNEGLGKLGLLDVVFGPCFLLSCPVEANKPKTILRWLNQQWNTCIAPAITDAVVKWPGTESEQGGQMKVASTALYVLMQRAIVPGCPLSGQEKDRYFAGFHGSNELDIKVRGERRDIKASPTSGLLPSVTVDGTATIRPNRMIAVTQQRPPVEGDMHTTEVGFVDGSSANEHLSAFAVAGIPSAGLSGSRDLHTTQHVLPTDSKLSPFDSRTGARQPATDFVRQSSSPWVLDQSLVRGTSPVPDAGSSATMGWSPVIMTQPGRTESPVQHLAKARSMTPPTRVFDQSTPDNAAARSNFPSSLQTKYAVLPSEAYDIGAFTPRKAVPEQHTRKGDMYMMGVRPSSAGIAGPTLLDMTGRVIKPTKVLPLSSVTTTFQ